MNVVLKNAEFVRELSLLEKVVAKKAPLPILDHVLIRAVDGKVELTTTDLELALMTSCNAEVAIKGAITLPIKRLIGLIKAQSANTLTLTADAAGNVQFVSGGFKSRLMTMSPDDYPKLQTPTDLPVINLSRVAVKDLLNQVAFAVADKESTNYMIKGALMALTDQKLTFVATDTSRLAVASVQRGDAGVDSVILPTKVINQLLALLNEPGDTPLQFAHNENHIFFTLDNRRMISRQIDGKFPAYERIIPKETANKMIVARDAFADVVKRLTHIDDVVVLTLSADALDVAAVSLDVGDASERIAVKYDGAPLQVRFRGNYVLDFLNAATNQSITLALNDEMSPVLFQDNTYQNVIMGMRV